MSRISNLEKQVGELEDFKEHADPLLSHLTREVRALVNEAVHTPRTEPEPKPEHPDIEVNGWKYRYDGNSPVSNCKIYKLIPCQRRESRLSDIAIPQPQMPPLTIFVSEKTQQDIFSLLQAYSGRWGIPQATDPSPFLCRDKFGNKIGKGDWFVWVAIDSKRVDISNPRKASHISGIKIISTEDHYYNPCDIVLIERAAANNG